MTRTEQGEHELVLGNKQLLSTFFVVVILLAIFFWMGYLYGKNAVTSGFNSGQTAANGGSRPDAAGRPLDTASSSPPAGAPDSTTPANDANGSGSPPPDTGASSTPPSAPPESSRPEPKAPETRTPPAPERTPEAPPARTESPASPQFYLQVSAVRKSDAENMVKILRERGFPARVGESPKQGLYRVLVGPFKTMSELGHTKTELKAKGFDSIIAR
jgi:cell division septation protein DedD